MDYEKMKKALVIMSQCDSLTITKDDKKFIIAAFASIIKFLREKGLISSMIVAKYAILKDATWNDGYFCVITRELCSMLNTQVEFYHKYFESIGVV